MTQLTPAQQERLSLLIEECGEVIQVASKMLRHGIEHDGHNNRIALEHELGDLRWAVGLLIAADDVWESTINRFAHDKRFAALRWLHHNDSFRSEL